MLIESNYYLNYKCLCSIIAHFPEMEENYKCLLRIIQTSTSNLIIKKKFPDTLGIRSDTPDKFTSRNIDLRDGRDHNYTVRNPHSISGGR